MDSGNEESVSDERLEEQYNLYNSTELSKNNPKLWFYSVLDTQLPSITGMFEITDNILNSIFVFYWVAGNVAIYMIGVVALYSPGKLNLRKETCFRVGKMLLAILLPSVGILRAIDRKDDLLEAEKGRQRRHST